MVVRISRSALAQMMERAVLSPAEEVCGVLLGSPDRISDMLPAPNVADDRTRRFEIDPAVLISAHRNARGGGPAVLLAMPPLLPRTAASGSSSLRRDGRYGGPARKDCMVVSCMRQPRSKMTIMMCRLHPCCHDGNRQMSRSHIQTFGSVTLHRFARRFCDERCFHRPKP
jgi:hypothetical protein